MLADWLAGTAEALIGRASLYGGAPPTDATATALVLAAAFAQLPAEIERAMQRPTCVDGALRGRAGLPATIAPVCALVVAAAATAAGDGAAGGGGGGGGGAAGSAVLHVMNDAPPPMLAKMADERAAPAAFADAGRAGRLN